MKTTRAMGAVALGAFAATFLGSMRSLAAELDKHSQDLTQERIEREREAQTAKVRAVDEAVGAVAQTREALNALDSNNKTGARTDLTQALGKLDVALSSHPGLDLIPLSVDVRVIDTHASDATIKRVTTLGRRLVKEGRFQAASSLFRELASEMDVVTVNVPVATYPPALRSAVQLIDQDKMAAAKSQLLSALQSLAVIQTVIPLPVIRAQALVDEVSRPAGTTKLDKKQADSLLTQADQQLALAERLGYGGRTQDFREVHSEIAQARTSLNHNQEPSGFLARIRTGLESLRSRFSRTPASPASSNESQQEQPAHRE